MHVCSIEDGWEEALGLPLDEFSKKCWVYRVICKVNGKHYIGISSDVQRRFSEHKQRSKGAVNPSTDSHLSRAMRKYGVDNFYVEPIIFGPREFCAMLEVAFIEMYDSYHSGYNSSTGGEGSSYYKPWNKGSKGLCKPNSTSFKPGGKSARQKLTDADVERILSEYSKGVLPKQMCWLPVHWSNAYRAIKKHKATQTA